MERRGAREKAWVGWVDGPISLWCSRTSTTSTTSAGAGAGAGADAGADADADAGVRTGVVVGRSFFPPGLATLSLPLPLSLSLLLLLLLVALTLPAVAGHSVIACNI